MKITWYDAFLENLQEKCPKKAELAEKIIDLLCIEREAVYRRLRKEVMFPIHEIVKIAATWNISLDEMTGINSGLIPFRMQPINYFEPSKIEMANLQKRIDKISHLITSPDSEYMEVSNKLPKSLHINSRLLYCFEIFKWAYQYNTDDTYKVFSNIVIPEEIDEELKVYHKYIKNVTSSYFIMDQMVFAHLVDDIQYFHSILAITDEEKELLKNELYAMLDYIMKIADNGCYPDTQKKVNIYISQLTINTNYSYYFTEQLKVCRVHAFGKFDIYSLDSELILNFRAWMNLKKKSSIQISEVDEKSRIEFFVKQRQLVDSL